MVRVALLSYHKGIRSSIFDIDLLSFLIRYENDCCSCLLLSRSLASRTFVHKCQKPRANCLGFVLQGTSLTLFSLGPHHSFWLTGKRKRHRKAHVSTKEGITAARWCISAPLQYKIELPLSGELSTQLTEG